jgi:D-alanyl-D-alanine carboxypeptidase
MTATDTLDRALDTFASSTGDDVPGVLMRVEQQDTGLVWQGARGVRASGGDQIEPGDCFRVASVAKTFTAATVLALVEDGRIEIDRPVVAYLAGPIRSLLDPIPAGSLDGITIERLLNHTSGLHDFGRDPEYLARVSREPAHRWSAAELVELSMRRGPMIGMPGAQFNYSDTGFTLLASAVEAVLGRDLPEAYHWMLDRGGVDLPSTWLEGREPEPLESPPRLHQYLGGADTYELDPSCDTWGGGGLVSTCEDLGRFVQALLAGEIVRDDRLLAWMLTCDQATDLGELGAFAGRGIFRTPVAGVQRYGHEGFWGVWMHHYPELDLTVTGAHTGVPIDDVVRRDLIVAPVRAILGGGR